MKWTHANRSIRDHVSNGRDLFLFERAQRKDGLWRFTHVVQFLRAKQEPRLDKTGRLREAIVFGLLRLSEEPGPIEMASKTDDLNGLRRAALDGSDDQASSVRNAIHNVYRRSAAVRAYALARAAGGCEACEQSAPFLTDVGMPFLEVHHIERLADNGPDRIDRVAAVCPNCHRRSHYSADRKQYNEDLRNKIAVVESNYEFKSA